MVAVQREERDVGFILQGLRHAIDKLELEFARFAAEFAQGEQWDDEGLNSAADWMRFNCHMTSSAAWRALQVGKHMEELPQSLEALSSGDIGYAHLATIANTADKVTGFEESELLPLAREHSPGKFHYKVMHYRHARDSKGYNREQEQLVEQSYLRQGTVQRLACDARVMRELFAAAWMPVAVGRCRRLVDGGWRKALAVRDEQCHWPGCERPDSWCDGHHVVHWVDGVETNLENTV